MAGKLTRVMYVERKTGFGDNGPARIGHVSFSHSGRTIYYNGKSFQSCGGQGIAGNYFDTETGDEYWISGPKKNGQDRHSAGGGLVAIDDDIVEEYWRAIRKCAPPRRSKAT